MFQPALEAAIESARAEIDAIASQTAPPTFENTILAMEESGGELDRVGTIYGIYASGLSSPAVQEVQRTVERIHDESVRLVCAFDNAPFFHDKAIAGPRLRER